MPAENYQPAKLTILWGNSGYSIWENRSFCYFCIMEEYVFSFPPVLAKEPRVLILGTMPGIASLDAQEYYAHPRNAFWKIMATLKGVEYPAIYDEKKQLIRDMNLALWDVCHTCVRPGSLDSNIRYEEPNAIAELLAKNPSIRVIIFNGQPAQKLFHKHFKSVTGVEFITMPSTSPTNTMIFGKKLENWRIIEQYL